ncbi:MAG TPA: ATP-binding protein [Chloroflexia bacterium]|nr:ATP-binding protein [Chloroflexia bacterium]
MKLVNRARNALWSVPVGLQLSLIYALLVAVTLAILGWALYAQLDGILVQNTVEKLDQVTQPVLRRPQRPQSSVEGVAARLTQDLGGRYDVVVAIRDSDGQILSSSQPSRDGTPLPIPDLPADWHGIVKADVQAKWIVKTPGNDRQLLMLMPITVRGLGDAPDARLYLQQSTSLAAADAILNQLRVYILLGILVGTFVGIIAGLALTRVVLRPLDRMVRTAEAIAGGDLDRRLRLPGGRNEVARLGGAFDHMVDRLAATLQAQRRFIADASHELRTPLTSLEGLSEMILIGADRGDGTAIQRMARSIHGELNRMARLVSDLLALSRLDSSAPISVGALDAGKLLEDVAEQMAPLAESRQVHLDVTHDITVPLKGDSDRLKQVILNLVDNALRYTPAEGRVTLTATLDPQAGRARIQVSDTGQGIPPEDIPHIFDRFYRGDPSRARASGNTGLGLAIARAIVQAHGGTIDVRSTLGAGATFTIVLPADLVNAAGSQPLSPSRKRHAVGTG